MKFTKEELENEEWLDVVGYEGLYQVSDLGRVKRLKNGKIYKAVYTIINKYIRIKFTKNKETKELKIHRLVMMAFEPNPENKPFVNHKNAIRSDNRRSNLEWCTHLENVKHALKMNLNPGKKNEENPNAKLCNEEVLQIVELLKTKELKEIGNMFNVHFSTISQIKTGKLWSNITGIEYKQKRFEKRKS